MVEELLTGNDGKVVGGKRWESCWLEMVEKLYTGKGGKVVHWKKWKSC